METGLYDHCLLLDNAASSGRLSNSLLKSTKFGGVSQAAPPVEHRNSNEITLSSAWHPDMLRTIFVDTGGPAHEPESFVHMSQFTAHAGLPMPGVGYCHLYSIVIFSDGPSSADTPPLGP